MGAELLLGVCDNINEIKMKVERYVSTQPRGLLVSSGARILQGGHRVSPLPGAYESQPAGGPLKVGPINESQRTHRKHIYRTSRNIQHPGGSRVQNSSLSISQSVAKC